LAKYRTQRSNYRHAALDEIREEKQKIITSIRADLTGCMARIEQIRTQVKDLENVRNQYELSLEAKIRVESVLRELADLKIKNENTDLAIDAELRNVRDELASNYDIDTKIKNAEQRISTLMKIYSNRFDFEKAYNPIKFAIFFRNV
jgi:acetolactate synthase small subunit